MALQVGELFASFTVDTKAAELALDRMEQAAERMVPRFAALGQAAVAALGQAMSAGAGQAIGSQFGLGAAQGILSAQGSVAAAASRLGAGAASALRSTLRVHSPSRVTREIGESFDMGLLNGMRGGMAQISRTAGGMGQLAADMLRQALPEGRREGAVLPDSVAASMGGETAIVRTTGDGGASLSVAGMARIMAQALSGVTVRMDGAAVGSLVAPTVSQAIAENATARRYGAE